MGKNASVTRNPTPHQKAEAIKRKARRKETIGQIARSYDWLAARQFEAAAMSAGFDRKMGAMRR